MTKTEVVLSFTGENRPGGYEAFSCSTQLFILRINAKMPTINDKMPQLKA